MAVYFDHKIEGPGSGSYTHTVWHNIHKIVAVGSYSDAGGGLISLFVNEGELVQDCKGLTRVCQPMVMQWHPTKKILAVGWESGEVQIWNEHDHELYEVTHLHKSEIKTVHWTSNGTRILTGDSTGLVAMWKTDSRGRPHQTVLCQHNLSEPLTTAVLRPPLPVDPHYDIVSLARAAVSGDESALDQFNWKKGKNARISTALLGPQEAVCFFLGGKNGGVYYLNESMKIVQVFVADGPVRNLLYYEAKNILVTVTITMMLSQHLVNQEGDTREMLKVKMSGKSQNPCIVWAGNGILGTATGESVVRMWDLENEENFVLNLEGQPGYEMNEFITCISFCPTKGVLAGGTGAGHVAMWQFSPIVTSTKNNKIEPEDRWKLQPPSTVEGSVSSLAWGSTKNLLSVNTVDNVYILNEQVMSASYRDQVAVVQISPTQMSVDLFNTSRHNDVKSDVQIKSIANTKENIAVLDGKRAIIYELTADSATIRVAGTFATETLLICLYEQNVYTLDPGKVQVRNFQGTIKQVINFQEAEGDPVSMDVCGQYLVIGSTSGCVKIFDLSRREAKQHGSSKQLADVIPDIGVLTSVKCNCNGSRVSIAMAKPNGSPDPKLYFWDVELDTVQYFNFETGRGEQDEYLSMTNEEDVSDVDKGKNQAAKDIAGRFPTSHQWDSKENKLLVCEAKMLPIDQSQKNQSVLGSPSKALGKRAMEEQVEVMIVPLFVTPENGVLIQDSFPMPSLNNRLIGAEVPYYYFMKKSEEAKEEQKTEDGTVVQPGSAGFQRIVNRRTMRDFVGLESADKNAIDAMMNFSYFLTIGNMDEAFKAIKLIKSESVWENMAKMCVKSRRLDVAFVCLGNMGHARGAKAMREAANEPELDAKVACLAIHLGLQDDAERLLKNCKRYDLLNEFYQSSGQWGKAMETAEMFDRVHLRTTYYNYAKHLESKGDINGAIPNYEKSETFRFEVPRMLFDEPQALEAYITNKKDGALLKWWAQYMESTGEMDTALLNYELSQDYLSLVRVYCYCGNMEKAAEICNETGDKAACYHLGRQFENNDMIKDAIHFFTRAGAYGNAIRLCREHGMEDQLMNLALLARPESMMEAARYYEFKPGHQDKAVMLYHKAGNFSKALDLAFTTKQFGALQMISEDLDDKTDPELLQRCADFFTENSQFDRAVDLLGAAKKYWEALKLCMAQHVPMTEELVEKLSPPKDGLSENESEERIKILEGIAEVCMQQRQYHLATKKYTQSGNKVKAMKALLKSGDTEKIVFFAGVSRQKEIYVMAANYLQSLDWRKDPEIMKNIIGFYTKGRALELLAGFYDACAQVEIDEYQNYDKALGALNEAYKCMAKAKVKNPTIQEERLGELKNKMTLIKKFVTARRTYEEDSEEGIKQCQVLLEEQTLDDAVRIGDVFGFIIEHYAKREKWKAAYSCMEEMRSRIPKANPAYYINMRTMESIYRALDIPLPKAPVNGIQMGGGGVGEEEEGEEVEEDVVDEFPHDDSVC